MSNYHKYFFLFHSLHSGFKEKDNLPILKKISSQHLKTENNLIIEYSIVKIVFFSLPDVFRGYVEKQITFFFLIYYSIFVSITDIGSLFCLFSVHIVQMLITKMRLVNSKDTYTTMNTLPKLPHPMNVFSVGKKIFVYKDYKNILIILEDLFIITNVLSAMNISNLIKNIR